MLLSLIMPAYNAEAFIKKALDNVFSQNIPFEYEFIAVNDGSTDGTAKILAEYAGNHPELTVLEEKNAGPAAARNLGISVARGEYIMFMDSDDAFYDGGIAKAVNFAEEKKSDLAVFGFDIISDGEKKTPYRTDPVFLSGSGAIKQKFPKLYSKNFFNQVWGKVFRTDIIKENGVLFPNRVYGEDRLFVFSYLSFSQSVAVTDEIYYKYCQQKGSLVASFVRDKFETVCEIDARARDFAGDAASVPVFDYMFMKSVMSCFSMLYSAKCPFSGKEKREYAKKILFSEHLSKKREYPADSGIAFFIFARAMEKKRVRTVLLLARAANFASGNFSGIFRRAKHAFNK